MRVLLVVPEFPPDYGGGISAYYGTLASALGEMGCTTTVLKGSAFTHGDRTYRSSFATVSTLDTQKLDKWALRFAHFAMFPELRRHLAAAFALHEQANAGCGHDVVEVVDWGLTFLPWLL